MNTTHPDSLGPAQIAEDAVFGYLSFLISLPRFEKRIEADVTMISADAPVFYFNAAFGACFNGNARQRIRETKEFFSERGRPFVWQITPSSRPADLNQILVCEGGELVESMPYMMLQLEETCRDSIPSAFHSESVRTLEMLYAWTSIYCRARDYSESADRLFNVLSDLDLSVSSPLQLILGYLNDEPVATYSVFAGSETAGFFSLSTLPEARGQGLGSAISIGAIDLALKHGCNTAALLSEPMSRNLCKRLGFLEGFGVMDTYRMPV